MNNTGKYSISDDYRQRIIRSIDERGLPIVGGIISWIDPDTGEVKPADPGWFFDNGIDLRLHINPKTLDESEESTRAALQKMIKWLKQHEKNEKIRDDTRGKFVFLEIKHGKRKTAISDIDYATLTRLAVLSSYLEYSGNRKKCTQGEKAEQTEGQQSQGDKIPTQPPRTNYIMRSDTRGHARATQRDIRRILRLPQRTWEQFWETCINNGYITGNDTDGYQLIDIFRYGKLERKKSTRIQKMYTDAYMRLYRTGRVVRINESRDLKISDHKWIGMLLRLAACYMHPDTNEIVSNPDETDHHKLRPMGITEIARALGFDADAGHAARDVGRLRDLTFMAADGREMFCLVRVEAGRGLGNVRYIINPALIYAGDRACYNPMVDMSHWYVNNNNG